ncbi:N-acetylmuramoyl-L-alanine amidase family protein [Vallitalea guaymasensis]|uniref:peptidoglycan recognition protein family protein n=1 Tax=Vallitalea guaymasensis TaxID=1185412 RepID=UPI002357ACDB|nr:N-acetylmuramoyl-L-alanine amidase [Vallitalea guaymasensis]
MNIIEDFIPSNRPNRPGVTMTPTSITVHNTGNARSGADAAMHASYIKSTNEKVSWHYTVDDYNVIQHIPIDEMAWHAGCRKGNETSIGIEICMNQGINMAMAEKNAQQLIAYLMAKTSITDIKKHQDWTGKYCPAVLLKEGRWEQFVRGCFCLFEEKKNIKKEHWAKTYYQQLIDRGLVIHEERLDDPITRGELFAILCRMLEL